MTIDLPPGSRDFGRSEIQPCAFCGQPPMHDGNITWYTVEVAQVVADLGSIRTQHALEVMLGPAGILAPVFAPTTRVGTMLPPVTKLICADCFLAHPDLALLWSNEADVQPGDSSPEKGDSVT